ncbi:Crp/Fnr family transcriptional regulator [Mucilaginibacter paludis]|uniref:Transcriptional regulator, Crp/Fnr family n=1 Tax=Mucilaginibacter paludis DSM 18603 TaxID=714943 RepID=H1YH95_9SPHI|nr:Crp/Fnr family transcriptional regulator [Mucilaginibacter paludis]EHQ24597.1 transcriptional regulator, Crp/Fnr family [Mucilaginibacter paludis DSM 18603]
MKVCKKDCDLDTCFLCKSCIKEWLPAIAAHRKNFEVKKGEIIFNEGDVVTGIYFVYSGVFKVHKKWGADKELIVRFAREGAIVGHRGMGTNAFYPVSATAIENSTVCFLDMAFFDATLKVNHEFTYQLMMFFADELQESERKMRNMAHMPVKGRIAQALLTLQDQFGISAQGAIGIELTRQDLASFAGATYETVFRVINDLVHAEAVRVTGKLIWIISRDQLMQIVSEGNS